MAKKFSVTDEAKPITGPLFDVVCDTSLTNGQSLTILLFVKSILDEQIADLQETINRETGKS